MYSYSLQVGFSECSPTQELKIPALVNYLQNCCMFHSDAIGYDLNHYYDIKRAWLLASWQIEIEELPKHAERINVFTKPYDFKNFYGMRNLWIENEAGKTIVKANSIWFFMDLEKGMPIKVEQREVDGYGIEEKLEMEYEDRRIKIPRDAKFDLVGEKVIVNEEMLDTNKHVNNGQYIKIAYDLLQKFGEKYGVTGKTLEAAGFYPSVRQIRAEYIKAAKYGDVMCGAIYKADNICYVKITDESDNAYAMVSFKCE